jgi:hypothetical protein
MPTPRSVLPLLFALGACSLRQGTPPAEDVAPGAVDASQPQRGGLDASVAVVDDASAEPRDSTVVTDSTVETGDSSLRDAGDGSLRDAGDGGPHETIGTGDIEAPAKGPPPSLSYALGGSAIDGGAYVLVKNWDFGTSGTIKDTSDLVSEFQFHNQFGTVANGTAYGGVIVAPTKETAIGNLKNLGLPDNEQPVEDPARPIRSYTDNTILCRVQPLSATQTTCTVSKHDVGAGSLIAKWTLPGGGELLGRDVLWETRMRFLNPCPAYWFALWTSGNQWNDGAEVDTPESFGAPNVFPPAHLFHVNSVGGEDALSYLHWSESMAEAGIPGGITDLTQWHVWTWIYRKDDTYATWLDDVQVQHGTIHWTVSGTPSGAPIDMTFLFDLTWGNNTVKSVDVTGVPASSVQMAYEIDYSRVYLR